MSVYPVSNEFMTQIMADERRVAAKIVIDFTDVFLDQSITVTTSEQANVSYPAHTADGIAAPRARYASLDGDWVLGQDFALAPTPTEAQFWQMGWWGSQLAGAGGAFITPFPVLSVTFAARPIRSLRVVGDSIRGERPVDFTIRLFAGATLVHTRAVTGNTLVDWSETITQVVDVTRTELEISRWSHAGRQAKILEFYTSIQEEYREDAIYSIGLLEEREAAQGTLQVGIVSANEIAVRLNNVDRRFDEGNLNSPLRGLLKPNRRIRAWLGVRRADATEEFVPLGTFWSGEWAAPRDKLYVHTVGRDRMELLRKSTYSASVVQANATLHNLAVAVLQDAGLFPAEYWIDTALQQTTVPWAWFDVMSHREALRIIAEAALAQVYCDREGRVRIEGPGWLYGQETFVMIGFAAMQSTPIAADNYYRRDNPTRRGEVANAVEVETQPLVPVSTAQEVYRSPTPVAIAAGQTLILTVHYTDRPVIDAVASLVGAPAGASITATTFRAWGAIVSVTSPNAGTFTLVVNGRPLRLQSRDRVAVEDADSIREHGRLRYTFPDNHLVQTLAVAQRIADTLLRMSRHPRRDLEVEWRGNPALLPGGIVAMQDHSQWGHFYIRRQEFDYDGGLHSRISGRRAT